MQIKDQLFVITGAARGLGQAIATHLAGKGATLALLDLEREMLEDSVLACRVAGGHAIAYACNVADEQSVAETFAEIVKQQGSIAGVVNNAGILRDALLVKVKDGEIVDRMSLQDWQSVIDVNLTGVFLCGREAATQMIKQGKGGVIINISSISKAGNAGQSNYAAAKSGVAAMTVTWARELSRYNIRCAGIAPGVFYTDMVAQMKPEAQDRLNQAVPLKRTGQVDELADSVAFIVENDYFNGRILELDGGLRL